jgi:hypothetical protein
MMCVAGQGFGGGMSYINQNVVLILTMHINNAEYVEEKELYRDVFAPAMSMSMVPAKYRVFSLSIYCS